MSFTEDDKNVIKGMFNLFKDSEFKNREYKEDKKEDKLENRNPFQRDYARILYSSSFRRLQGKMQILGVDNASFYRNRLTHSLEVAQIANGILLKLHEVIGDEAIPLDHHYVLEAAALAHDIGHPAFGHSGERVLDELGRKYGIRFEGNAHNFRVLRTIEKKLPTFKGLNLTYRTLLAINKYLPCESDGNGTVEKFMFKDDYEKLSEFREKHNINQRRTIDVQIIELADDIAYAVHDLEDGLSTRSFTIEELKYRLSTNHKDLSLDDFEVVVKEAYEEANKSKSYGTTQEFSQVLRQTLTSKLTKLFLSDLSLENPSKRECKKRGTKEEYKELSLGKHSELCKAVSKEVFECIIREPHIALYEARGKKLISDLFNLYSNPNLNKKGRLFPPDFRQDLFEGENPIPKAFAQAAIDYIAGMMDDFAKLQYKQLFNTDFDKIPILTDNSQKDQTNINIGNFYSSTSTEVNITWIGTD